jgi:hypothetical protein
VPLPEQCGRPQPFNARRSQTEVRSLCRKRDSGIVLGFAYCGLQWFVLSSFPFVMRVVTRRLLPLRGLLAV